MVCVILASVVAIACAKQSEPARDLTESGTPGRPTGPLPTRVLPPTLTSLPPALLALTSFDCAGDQYFGGIATIVRASGRVRNSSSQTFTNLGVQLIVFNNLGEGIMPFLERGPYVGLGVSATPSPETLQQDNVGKTAVFVEPRALQPGQEASFQFPALGNPIPAAGLGGLLKRCSVRFVDCTVDCRDVPFADLR